MLTKLLFVPFMLISFVAHAELFQASFTNTKWQVSDSPLKCVLSQDITGFGNAKFIQLPGQQFSMVFTTPSHPSRQTNVSFEIAEAPWQNIEERLHLISMPTENNQKQFTLSGDLAKQAYTHIEEGKFPAVRYLSHKSKEEISALLSTVHFRDSHLTFSECVENMFPFTFEQMRKLTVHFQLEDSELTTEAKTALRKMADYVKIDPKVSRLTIAGHTDNHGRKRINIPLAEARAIVVKNFLIEECEVPERLITTSWHREFIAATSNKTIVGRSINRRAEIELIR